MHRQAWPAAGLTPAIEQPANAAGIRAFRVSRAIHSACSSKIQARGDSIKTIASALALLIAGSTAHADPLVERIVDQLEASPSGCSPVPRADPQRQLIESDIRNFRKDAPIPPGIAFSVMDCAVDGFVHRGQTVVVSTRLSRLPPTQRFFILAHELGHLVLRHRAAISSFVAQAVDSTPDEPSARALIASGLATVSHRAEIEADAYAARLMRDTGRDPEDAARLFDSLGEGADNATHPSTGARARAIRAWR